MKIIKLFTGLLVVLLIGCGGTDESDSDGAIVETPSATQAPTSAPVTPDAEPTEQAPSATSAAAIQPAPVSTAVPAAAQPTALPPTVAPAPPLATVSNPSGVCIEAWTPGEVIENLLIGPCGGEGIDIRASGIIVRNVTIFNAETAIRVHETTGVLIENNTLRDPRNSGGGFVQQISVDNASDVRIRGNVLSCGGAPACAQEDAIGIFRSSNVIVEGNSITGGNSESGCGVLADHGALRVTIRGNTIRNQANCGIGVANGTDHLVEGNDIAVFGNVGIYVWNQYGGQCARVTVRNNVVAGSNPWWNGDNCSQVAVTGNNFSDD